MRLVPVVRSLVKAAGFAVVTATAVLALAMPRTTYADDGDDAALGTADGTRVDHVVVTTHIRRDAGSRAGWSLVIEAENAGNLSETCRFKTAVERWFVTPMARTASDVTTLITRVESLTVPAHQKVRLVREVPAWIAEQLVTAERMEKARAAETKRAENDPAAYASAIMRAPYPDFHVSVLAPDAKVERKRQEGGMMMMMAPPPPIPTPSGGAVPELDSVF